MSVPIAALVYADGVYPDPVIRLAVEPLQEAGIPLAGLLQRPATSRLDCPPCDLLLEDLASGTITAIVENRGKEARGCRLDIHLLTELAEAVEQDLCADGPRLLVVNKFGKIEVGGGGLRQAIAAAVDLGIPVLVGGPERNLDSWRAFAGSLAMELPAEKAAIDEWLGRHGLTRGSLGQFHEADVDQRWTV